MGSPTESGVAEVPVLFQELSCADGMIGVATLNTPRSINALSLEMIDLLDARLRAWQADDRVVLVVLDGAGEKGFCAGGDIVRLYASMVDTPAGMDNRYAADFFSREYRLDYLIHEYGKPLLCWGHGVVMGGGLGLLAGASERVLTLESRIAMPEITIGLFPDVAGSWFLPRMPGHSGLFLGLTGARLNCHDALFCGLADRVIAQPHKGAVIAALCDARWHRAPQKDAQVLAEVLALFQLPVDELPASPVRQHLDHINLLCDGHDLARVVDNITAMQSTDPWLGAAARTLAGGCARTAWLVWECQRRGRHLSLAEVFRMEWGVAMQCARDGEFREGVRALLVDKDGAPAFRWRSVAEVPAAAVEACFNVPSPHPLADL